MENDNTITLGGNSHPIAPLSLGQMRQAVPCMMRLGVDTVDGMGANITVIYHGMKAANPNVKPEDIDEIKGVTFAEIKEAVEKIAKLTGLEMKKAPKPGEGKPAADEPAKALQNGTGDISAQN